MVNNKRQQPHQESQISENSRNGSPSDSSGNGNKGPKASNKGKPDYVTPEYIAQQRSKREAAKAAKAAEKQALELSNPEGPFGKKSKPAVSLEFIKRPMLRIPFVHPELRSSSIFTIMTYNVLGQALVRRTLFPTNGDILKWKYRGPVILSEFKYYNADIMCLQEVDYEKHDSFYGKNFKELGYDYVFARSGKKNHGLMIAWKRDIFSLIQQEEIHFDEQTTDSVPAQCRTRNLALLAAFKLNKVSCDANVDLQGPQRSGIVVGTCHLFWHPYGTMERVRQAAIYVREATRFKTSLCENDDKDWPIFLTGDFNSMPIDAPYLAMTTKPMKHTARSTFILENSREHDYSNRAEEDEGGEEEEEGEDEGPPPYEGPADENTDFGTITPAPCLEEEGEEENNEIMNVDDVVPADMVGSGKPKPTWLDPESTKRLISYCNSIPAVCRSLYGWGYRFVHAPNADLTKRNGEPEFSNWAHNWRGLLDYIFIVDEKHSHHHDSQHYHPETDIVSGVKVLELLRLPTPSEMGQEPSGQPREGQYPSDHLCLMAKVEIEH